MIHTLPNTKYYRDILNAETLYQFHIKKETISITCNNEITTQELINQLNHIAYRHCIPQTKYSL